MGKVALEHLGISAHPAFQCFFLEDDFLVVNRKFGLLLATREVSISSGLGSTRGEPKMSGLHVVSLMARVRFLAVSKGKFSAIQLPQFKGHGVFALEDRFLDAPALWAKADE